MVQSFELRSMKNIILVYHRYVFAGWYPFMFDNVEAGEREPEMLRQARSTFRSSRKKKLIQYKRSDAISAKSLSWKLIFLIVFKST